VCDLYRIATKYDLLQYFDVFTSETNFLDKKSWRVVVDAAILGVEKRFLLESVSQDPTLTRFYEIQGNCHSFHPVWVAEARTSGHKKHYRDLAKLNCVKQGKYLNKLCSYCSKMYFDQLDHYFHHCSKYSPHREAFWTTVINSCSVQLSGYLYNLPDESITAIILGKRPCVYALNEEVSMLLEIGAKIWQAVAHESELRFF
jgi:hypothetical protein